MALVKCPECGKENVSDSAKCCPQCGYPIRNHYRKKLLLEKKNGVARARPGIISIIISLLLAVITFAGVFLGIELYNADIYTVNGSKELCYWVKNSNYSSNIYHSNVSCPSLWQYNQKTTVYEAELAGREPCKYCDFNYVPKHITEWDEDIHPTAAVASSVSALALFVIINAAVMIKKKKLMSQTASDTPADEYIPLPESEKEAEEYTPPKQINIPNSVPKFFFIAAVLFFLGFLKCAVDNNIYYNYNNDIAMVVFLVLCFLCICIGYILNLKISAYKEYCQKNNIDKQSNAPSKIRSRKSINLIFALQLVGIWLGIFLAYSFISLMIAVVTGYKPGQLFTFGIVCLQIYLTKVAVSRRKKRLAEIEKK